MYDNVLQNPDRFVFKILLEPDTYTAKWTKMTTEIHYKKKKQT